VRSVARYLEDDLNTVPTSIVISLAIPPERYPQGQGLRSANITIENTGDNKPGIVIDGQHRLIGISRFDPSIHVNVVALLTDDPDEAAFQFFIINNKASRVSTDHIKALLSERASEKLRNRLKKSRLAIGDSYRYVSIADTDDESPFKSLVDWPSNRSATKWIKPLAIEVAVNDIQERKIRVFQDEDFVIDCFFLMWAAVRNKWPHLWIEGSSLLSKVGVVCMTQYLTNILVNASDLGELDIGNLNSTRLRIEGALVYQSDQLWLTPWEPGSYDTLTGRKQVVQSLVQVSRNLRSGEDWSEDVTVLANG
jgi:DGQHR domain-containing protein